MISELTELWGNLAIFLFLILVAIMVALAIVTGVYYRNVMKVTARIDDINNTLVSYAQKNGGINASTPDFDYTNINELKDALIAAHNLSSQIVTADEIVVSQEDASAIRGSIVTVTTSFRIPIFVVSGLRGRVTYVTARPRVAEGIVHQYVK